MTAGSTSRIRLAVRLLHFHRLQALGPLLVAMLLGATVVGLSAVAVTGADAVEQSLRWEFADRAYALQSTEVEAVAGSGAGGSPVADAAGELTVGGRSAAVTVRSTSDPDLPLGLLTVGRRPQAPDEVLLARGMAQALGALPGTEAQLSVDGTPTQVTVVGLLADPMSSQSRAVVHLTRAEDLSGVSRWLLDEDPYANGTLQPMLDARAATYQSLDSLLHAAAAQQPPFLSGLRHVPLGAGLLLGGVLLATSGILRRAWARDVDGLVAAGLPPRAAEGVVGLALTLLAMAGAVLGALAALAALLLARGRVSGWLGQDWVDVLVPWRTLAVLLLALLVVALLHLPLTRVSGPAAARLSDLVSGRRTRLPATVASGVVVAGLGVMVAVTQVPALARTETLLLLVPAAALCVCLALPFALVPVASWRRSRASASVIRHLARGLTMVAAAAAAITVATGFLAATTTYAANSGEAESSPYVPAGSLVLSQVPDSTVEAIEERYRARGGGEVLTYGYLADAAPQIRRVSSVALGRCAQRDPTTPLDLVDESCWPQLTSSPVNVIMTGTGGTGPRADPGLSEGGSVAILTLTPEGAVAGVTQLEAEADPLLGGNLPGLVLPPASPLVEELSLAPTGSSMVLLPDFHQLSPTDRFELRAELLRLAAGAQTADGTDPTAYDRQRSLATLLAVLGAAASGLVVVLGGTALVSAHRVTRRTLTALAAHPGTRRHLALRWISVAVVVLVLTLPLTYLAASYGGRADAYGFGWLWTAPALSALAGCAVVLRAFLQVPASSQE
ncbi:hypothetical protein [Ornithinimicrobium cerasi]|uniref:hypothetical protein n=1 Tax=Ornithinimicrobium cerasi TaxID=2248773 RepID=UPI000F00C341|nr:hypothetical protein [Ornithinimicrobium cerasi]